MMCPGKSSRIFNKISIVGPDFVSSHFGPVGQKLASMFGDFGNHPETDLLFFEDCDLHLCDLIDVVHYAEKNNMPFLRQHLPHLVSSQSSERLKKSVVPPRNGSYARLLRRPLRQDARKTRKVQFVRSKKFNERLRAIWDCIPSDFSQFFKNLAQVKHHLLDEAAKKFSEMGCTSLAEASSEMAFRFHRPDDCFGYKKINVVDACMIMAKHNGFVVEDDGIFTCVSGGVRVAFALVPIHLLKSIPEGVSQCLDDAEHCRSLMFEPAFDDCLLLVPFPDGEHLDELLDLIDSERNEFNSVVLGERNGECYFICSWERLE